MRGLLHAEMEIERYARGSLDALLRRLAFQMNRAGKTGGVESIHDLRVAIRRLSQGLRLFAPLLKKGAAAKVDRRIGRLRRAAGEVRDLDIALAFVRASRVDRNLAARLAERRKRAYAGLRDELERAIRRELWRKWGGRLEVRP